MRLFTLYACTVASIGSFLFGYDSGIITTTISHDTFLQYMKTTSSSQEIGALTSTYAAGEAIGALIGMYINDALGRKKTAQIFGLWVTVGAIIQTASVNIGMLIAGRIITGIGIGSLLIVAPLYNSEISTAETRGLLTGLTAQFIGIGFMISNWIGFACSYASGQFQWRFPLALQIPWGVLLAIGFMNLPETPRWLLLKDRGDEALEVLKRLHANETEDFITSEYTQMYEQINYERATEVKSLLEMWKKYKKRLGLGIAIQSLTQLTGVNVINYYQTNLYRGVGITGHTVLLISSLYGMVGPATNIYTITQIDKWGRVKTLWIDALALAVDMAIVMGLTARYDQTGSKVVSGFAIAFIFLFSIIYSLGFNAVSWIYTVEIFNSQIRGRATSISAFANFVTNIVFNQISPSAFANIGYKYYAVFISINCATALLIYLFFPETKQKSLEEIAALFGDTVVVPELSTILKETEEKHKLDDEETHIEDEEAASV